MVCSLKLSLDVQILLVLTLSLLKVPYPDQNIQIIYFMRNLHQQMIFQNKCLLAKHESIPTTSISATY